MKRRKQSETKAGKPRISKSPQARSVLKELRELLGVSTSIGAMTLAVELSHHDRELAIKLDYSERVYY